MIQKLLALVAGDCVPDNPDSPMSHEILLPGHLLQMFLKVFFFFLLHVFRPIVIFLLLETGKTG